MKRIFCCSSNRINIITLNVSVEKKVNTSYKSQKCSKCEDIEESKKTYINSTNKQGSHVSEEIKNESLSILSKDKRSVSRETFVYLGACK